MADLHMQHWRKSCHFHQLWRLLQIMTFNWWFWFTPINPIVWWLLNRNRRVPVNTWRLIHRCSIWGYLLISVHLNFIKVCCILLLGLYSVIYDMVLHLNQGSFYERKQYISSLVVNSLSHDLHFSVLVVSCWGCICFKDRLVWVCLLFILAWLPMAALRSLTVHGQSTVLCSLQFDLNRNSSNSPVFFSCLKLFSSVSL